MPPNTTPVTAACVRKASEMQQVPMAALIAIMQTEKGRLGRKSKNPDGTYDYGPMQINTRWLEDVHKAGVNTKTLMNDGCINVYIGAWILKGEIVQAKSNIWDAIGHYHSKTPHLAARYRKKVFKEMQSLKSIKSVISYANQ